MRITFGLHVAGWRGPGSKSLLGEPVVGRPGFLALLETHLGLSAPTVAAAQRAAAYLVALRAGSTTGRFFDRSLQADEIGTAAHLLRWRDEWFLAGWDGKGRAQWPQRLADLAAVEAFATGRVPPGEGERLALVAERLKRRRTPIDHVLLLDPLAAYPARWRDVLELLPTEAAAPVQPAGQGTLGALQEACLQALSQGKLPALSDLAIDETVFVLRPLSCETAEHWLAARCRATPRASRMMVSEEQGPSVDDTLRVNGLPSCGFDEPSTLRPALQALPLALETLWDPIEPGHLLEFLMHPVGPFSGKARRLLGAAFAVQPGIGGQAWIGAREKIEQDLGAEVVAQVAWWLEGSRSNRVEGAPLEHVIARVSRLQEAMQARLGNLELTDPAAGDLGAAIGQCTAVLQGLQELRQEGAIATVRPRLLEQLTAHATSDSGSSLAVAEVGCMQSATSPAACAVESADEVIWWMPAQPALPAPHPWVQAELQALDAGGVHLRDPAAEMAGLMAQWVRPVLAARQHLILVLPPEGAEEHPAWQLLKVLAPSLPVAQLESHALARNQIQAVPPQPLPLARGAWKLDQHSAWRAAYVAPTRLQSQSYSSLDVLFNNPAVAVLREAAALRSGRALAVEQDTRLLGTLAHRLLEKLFGQKGALQWTEPQLDQWFPATLEDLLRREGMPLLAPGSAMQREQFRATVRQGMSALLEMLRHAGAVRVLAERDLAGNLGTIDLNGKTDLLIELPAGATAALDLKWARATRFRNLLAQGEFLQLALYAHMIEQDLGQAPSAVGYFTFLDTTLLTLTPNLFGPRARVVEPKNGLTSAQLVLMARASWEWRVQQWQAGHVEVIGKDLDPPSTEPPEQCLRLRELGPWFGDYEALFGQQENA